MRNWEMISIHTSSVIQGDWKLHMQSLTSSREHYHDKFVYRKLEWRSVYSLKNIECLIIREAASYFCTEIKIMKNKN